MKTICIYHSIDLDGWMSAAIVKYWFIETNRKDYYILNEDGSIDKTAPGISNNLLNFLGYNYGDPIPDLSGYDKVIMCDVSFPLEDMKHIAIDILDSNNTDKFIWLDHHKSAIEAMYGFMWNYSYIKGLQEDKFASCELTWKYFFPGEKMPEIVRLLGRYDCFGHKGTDEEQKVLEFQYGARAHISNYEDAYFYLNNLKHCMNIDDLEESGEGIYLVKGGSSIYKYLCTEAKQIYKRAFPVEFGVGVKEFNKQKQKDDFYGSHYKFLCVNQERFNPINFGIDYHKDGYDGFACFHYANSVWNFSLYNDNGEVDCSTIAKQYGGGGHKGAAGFRVDNLSNIIK